MIIAGQHSANYWLLTTGVNNIELQSSIRIRTFVNTSRLSGTPCSILFLQLKSNYTDLKFIDSLGSFLKIELAEVDITFDDNSLLFLFYFVLNFDYCTQDLLTELTTCEQFLNKFYFLVLILLKNSVVHNIHHWVNSVSIRASEQTNAELNVR